VIEVRVGQDDSIDVTRRSGELLVALIRFVPAALEEAAVEVDLRVAGLDDV
jgi:hypothetical protein